MKDSGEKIEKGNDSVVVLGRMIRKDFIEVIVKQRFERGEVSELVM